MAAQKIKFKMSLKELSFEFEGDIETGQRIQTDIRKSLTALTHSPATVLPADPNLIEGEVASSNGNGKPAKIGRSYKPRRGKANTPRALIVRLRQTGFFTQKRDASSIQTELAKQGHNFKPNEISAALIGICKKQILKRDQGEGGKFEYEAGDADVDAGASEDAE